MAAGPAEGGTATTPGLLPPWPGEPVRVGGASLFVRRSPAPPGSETAVLVHGLGGASTNWTDLMGLLAGQVACFAPDLPGFGYSDPPAGRRYSLDAHARAVVGLIERLGDGPVHLFGNSMGGAVATRVAAERPELIRTLTLVSPALPDLRPRRGTDLRLGLLLVPGLASSVSWQLGRQPAMTRAKAVVQLCFAHPERVPAERLAEAADELARRRDLAWGNEALVRSLRGLIAAHLEVGPRALWRQAAAVSAPTLLVWGKHDRLVHHAVGSRAARAFPDSRLLVLDECGHVAQMEEPATVAGAWREMVAGRPRPAA